MSAAVPYSSRVSGEKSSLRRVHVVWDLNTAYPHENHINTTTIKHGDDNSGHHGMLQCVQRIRAFCQHFAKSTNLAEGGGSAAEGLLVSIVRFEAHADISSVLPSRRQQLPLQQSAVDVVLSTRKSKSTTTTKEKNNTVEVGHSTNRRVRSGDVLVVISANEAFVERHALTLHRPEDLQLNTVNCVVLGPNHMRETVVEKQSLQFVHWDTVLLAPELRQQSSSSQSTASRHIDSQSRTTQSTSSLSSSSPSSAILLRVCKLLWKQVKEANEEDNAMNTAENLAKKDDKLVHACLLLAVQWLMRNVTGAVKIKTLRKKKGEKRKRNADTDADSGNMTAGNDDSYLRIDTQRLRAFAPVAREYPETAKRQLVLVETIRNAALLIAGKNNNDDDSVVTVLPEEIIHGPADTLKNVSKLRTVLLGFALTQVFLRHANVEDRYLSKLLNAFSMMEHNGIISIQRKCKLK